jgi:hypothetical protein
VSVSRAGAGTRLLFKLEAFAFVFRPGLVLVGIGSVGVGIGVVVGSVGVGIGVVVGSVGAPPAASMAFLKAV